MQRHVARIVLSCVSIVGLVGCSSTEPAAHRHEQPATARCAECGGWSRVENMYCADCAHHTPAPAPVAAEGPAATPAVPAPPRGVNRIIFLNRFSPTEAERVIAALESDPDFRDYIPGGGTPERVSVEIKYTGSDIRLSLSRVLRGLGIKFHFQETSMPNHVEVHKG